MCVVVDAGGCVCVLMSWVAVIVGIAVVAGCVRCVCSFVYVVDVGGGMLMVLIVFLVVAGYVACICYWCLWW